MHDTRWVGQRGSPTGAGMLGKARYIYYIFIYVFIYLIYIIYNYIYILMYS